MLDGRSQVKAAAIKASGALLAAALLSVFWVVPAWDASRSTPQTLPVPRSSIVLLTEHTDLQVQYFATFETDPADDEGDTKVRFTMSLVQPPRPDASGDVEEGSAEPQADTQGDPEPSTNRSFTAIVRGDLQDQFKRCEDAEIEQESITFGKLSPVERTAVQKAVNDQLQAQGQPDAVEDELSGSNGSAAVVAGEEEYLRISLLKEFAGTPRSMVLECALSRGALWSHAADTSTLQTPLVYGAFTLNGWEGGSRFGYTRASVDALPSEQLFYVRSVPEPEVQEDGGLLWQDGEWDASPWSSEGTHLRRIEGVSALYTNAPQEAARRGQIFIGGIAGGLAAALLVGAISAGVDLLLWRHARREEAKREVAAAAEGDERATPD